jgi:hypothetical protein
MDIKHASACAFALEFTFLSSLFSYFEQVDTESK